MTGEVLGSVNLRCIAPFSHQLKTQYMIHLVIALPYGAI